jgi:hypothetical protein
MNMFEDFPVTDLIVLAICHFSAIFSLVMWQQLRWVGHIARMMEVGRAFNILTGRPTGNIS